MRAVNAMHKPKLLKMICARWDLKVSGKIRLVDLYTFKNPKQYLTFGHGHSTLLKYRNL